jgi:hypothetical protein
VWRLSERCSHERQIRNDLTAASQIAGDGDVLDALRSERFCGVLQQLRGAVGAHAPLNVAREGSAFQDLALGGQAEAFHLT